MEISDILIEWYGKNKRDLLWRETTDPYIIWISEIILQQTRVAQGKDYFQRFTERFPDIQSLAEAHEDEVLKYWEGLGYYSRARNLHAAARRIMEQYGGKFPVEYEEVLSLKGIGEYTAAAIVSFAWNKPYPAVDGNVFRVLSRLFALDTPIDTGKGKKEYTELAASVMNPARAGLHNQAIMEFGALQCTPQNPVCMFCPLQSKCMGYASGSPLSYPVKQNKTKTRNRYFHYLHILCKGKTWLNRRSGKDIWKGLYEFPLIETETPADFTQLQENDNFRQLLKEAGKLSISVELSDVKHVLSHQILYAAFYKIEIEKIPGSLQSYIEIPGDTINEYAVPRLLRIYLEK
ncbi:MAG: A/G-specific adenine glycosylase [Tannerellaceae bacterium]|jgi:A/G-specific adenine glycosylase|nr:A/G-specific adenine glycosylase [Tannerellaceae bacterium]